MHRKLFCNHLLASDCLPAGILGVPPAQLESPGFDTLLQLIQQPGDQAKELQQALLSVARGADAAAATDVAVQVVEQVAGVLAVRAGVGVDTLFPMRTAMLRSVGRPGLESSSSSSSLSSGSSDFAAPPAAAAATVTPSSSSSSNGVGVVSTAHSTGHGAGSVVTGSHGSSSSSSNDQPVGVYISTSSGKPLVMRQL